MTPFHLEPRRADAQTGAYALPSGGPLPADLTYGRSPN